MRRHPLVIEIPAHHLLNRLSRRHGRRLTLCGIPDDLWCDLARRGFDFVWLMGVWKRSGGSRAKALSDPGLRRAYDEILPGWTEADVGGSPYAIESYTLDPGLGAEDELLKLRRRLNRLGIGLMLDFVPNHLALDNQLTLAHPEWFIRARPAVALEHPEWFFETRAGELLAHGRDPNFLPWTDTVQVDLLHPGARAELAAQLTRIGELADAVRCDMAMLALTSVFTRTWEGLALPRPPGTPEFWEDLLGQVRSRHPAMRFVAEVYWDMESRVQELGFDYTYDKTLYDRLLGGEAPAVREHVEAPSFDPCRAVRFIENHDEPRALEAFGRDRSLAAAAVVATLPGMRLFQDGQLEGSRLKIPIQLLGGPLEATLPEVAEVYDRLLGFCADDALHDGEWALLEASHPDLLAWCWRHRNRTRLIVVNFGPHRSAGRLGPEWVPAGQDPIVLRDAMTGEVYTRDARELRRPGLYVELDGWRSHLFEVRE